MVRCGADSALFGKPAPAPQGSVSEGSVRVRCGVQRVKKERERNKTLAIKYVSNYYILIYHLSILSESSTSKSGSIACHAWSIALRRPSR